MARSEFTTEVTCDRCGETIMMELPERYQARGQSYIDEALERQDWRIGVRSGKDYCPRCRPPEADSW